MANHSSEISLHVPHFVPHLGNKSSQLGTNANGFAGGISTSKFNAVAIDRCPYYSPLDGLLISGFQVRVLGGSPLLFLCSFFQLIGSRRFCCCPFLRGGKGTPTLPTARRLESGTECVHTRSVVSMSDCPRISCAARIVAPDSLSHVAWVEGTYFFDTSALMVAKVACYLKESLGTRMSVLSKLMEAVSASEGEFKSENPKCIMFNCRLAAEEEPIKLGVPFRAFGEQIEERMNRADLYKDLPHGKKRPGWKKEFLESLTEAAKDIGEVSGEEILRMVRSCRKERRAPEITVAAEG